MEFWLGFCMDVEMLAWLEGIDRDTQKERMAQGIAHIILISLCCVIFPYLQLKFKMLFRRTRKDQQTVKLVSNFSLWAVIPQRIRWINYLNRSALNLRQRFYIYEDCKRDILTLRIRNYTKWILDHLFSKHIEAAKKSIYYTITQTVVLY